MPAQIASAAFFSFAYRELSAATGALLPTPAKSHRPIARTVPENGRVMLVMGLPLEIAVEDVDLGHALERGGLADHVQRRHPRLLGGVGLDGADDGPAADLVEGLGDQLADIFEQLETGGAKSSKVSGAGTHSVSRRVV